MNRLILAFERDDDIARVRDMLAAASIAPRLIHHTGADVLRSVGFMGGGIVVCGAKLADMTADRLYAHLDGMARMLVIDRPPLLEMHAACGAFKLPLPINRFNLGASVRMLMHLEASDLKQRRSRTSREDRVIHQAKEILRSTLGMTEAEAHRYLQKRSMDAGVRIAQTAAMIIDEGAS